MVTGRSPKVIRLDLVNESLRPVLAQALEDEPGNRFQSVSEFRDALRTSLTESETEVVQDVELGSGECGQCHTKNDQSRKFCRECAASLRVNCLQCEREIPVWDKVCGECGAKQSELAEARRALRQEQAEKLLKQYDYDAAAQIATGLCDEPDSRFRQLKEWAEQFLQDVDREREQQLARIADLVQEALQHEEAYDYQPGIHALEQVPEILRDQPIPGQSSAVSPLLSRLGDKLGESQRLDQIIRQRVKAKQVTGLLDEVEALLHLRPDRKNVVKLRDQLIDREKENAADVVVTEDGISELHSILLLRQNKGKTKIYDPYDNTERWVKTENLRQAFEEAKNLTKNSSFSSKARGIMVGGEVSPNK